MNLMDPEIVIGYVDEFLFTDKSTETQLSGHPKAGRIYRILKSEGSYLLHIGATNNKANLDGIFLGESLIGDMDNKWQFKISLISKENYLDYSITTEDLDLLLQWFESDHADLKRKMNLPIINVDTTSKVAEGKDSVRNIIKEVIGSRKKATDAFITKSKKDLNVIADFDPFMVEVLAEFISYLTRSYDPKYEDHNVPNLAKDIQMSNTMGKGANIFSIVKNVQAYSTSGFHESENIGLLFEAMHYCLEEIQRKKLHE